jgi:hypothetical protein
MQRLQKGVRKTVNLQIELNDCLSGHPQNKLTLKSRIRLSAPATMRTGTRAEGWNCIAVTGPSEREAWFASRSLVTASSVGGRASRGAAAISIGPVVGSSTGSSSESELEYEDWDSRRVLFEREIAHCGTG